MTQPKKYDEQINCLAHIYLEDSFVLSLIEQQGAIEFELDAVLTKEHPSYHPPMPDEQYCYKRSVLRLRSCSNVNWIRKSLTPSTDANGEIDYGNIDHFSVTKDQMHLSGDWGEVRLNCLDVSLQFT